MEYKARKQLISEGWITIRASGSHGVFDLVAFRDDMPAYGIQVKATTGGMSQVAYLIKKFKASPPLKVSQLYTQAMWVWDGKRWHWGLV